MFYGEYHHQLDDKGRLRIPPRFRELLGDDPMMIVGFDGCVMIYTKEQFDERIVKRFKNADILNARMNRLMRAMLSGAQPVAEDKQGRVPLNPTIKEKCGIDKNLITIGVLDHVEVWGEEAYKKYMAEVDIRSILTDETE